MKGRLNEQVLPPLKPSRAKELAACEEIWRSKKKEIVYHTATTKVENHDHETAIPIVQMSDLREIPELGDLDIDQLQTMLRMHFPDVGGLQSVVLGQCMLNVSLPKFSPVESCKRFVQILNVGDHWVSITNRFSD
jgi:hypothetical protein